MKKRITLYSNAVGGQLVPYTMVADMDDPKRRLTCIDEIDLKGKTSTLMIMGMIDIDRIAFFCNNEWAGAIEIEIA